METPVSLITPYVRQGFSSETGTWSMENIMGSLILSLYECLQVCECVWQFTYQSDTSYLVCGHMCILMLMHADTCDHTF